jgi:hypothetical protein
LKTPGEPWRMAGQFGFVLEDVKPLPFKPCAGALGFWRCAHFVEAEP